MSLVHPAMLLWFLPLGAGLVLLYMLRMKRRDFRVPAVFLWPQRTEDVRANSFFQPPRFSLLFWLQLFVLGLLVLALARPQIRQQGLSGGVTVFVLDVSASMSANDVAPSRFEAARAVVRQSLQTLRAGERNALIEAGPEPRVVFPLQNEVAVQRRLLDQVQPTDAESNLGEALRLAGALVGTEAAAKIVLLSDGATGPVRDFSPGKAQFVFQSFGEQDRNVRVSALGVRDRSVYVEAENMAGTAMRGTLKVEVDGILLDSQKFDLGPGKTVGKTLRLPGQGTTVSAEIETDDQLKADNFATVPVASTGRIRVLLVSPGNLFLERALALDPRVTLDRAAALPPDGGEDFDVVIFDGVAETAAKAPRVVNFGAVGSPWVRRVGEVNSAEAKLDLTPGALLTGVDLAGVFFGETARLDLNEGAETIAESTAGPLIVRTPNGIVTAFRPLDSDFPLQVGFPIFVANLLDLLAPESGLAPIEARPGRAISIATNAPITLRRPGGSEEKLTPVDGTVLIRSLKTAGTYSLQTSEGIRPVFVSLSSATESNIAPQKLLETTAGRVEAVRAPERLADFIIPLLALILLLLVGEWFTFLRKS